LGGLLSLYALANKHGHSKINLLKMDRYVEGFEFVLFDLFFATEKNHHDFLPMQILDEVHDRTRGVELRGN
jgi:hypothetical protein